MVQHKTCARCKHSLPVTEFRVNSRYSDGYWSYCKECKKAIQREDHAKHRSRRNALMREAYRRNPESYKQRAATRYEAMPDVVKADVKRWQEQHPDRVKAIKTKSFRKRYAENPEPIREIWRRRHALKLASAVVEFTTEALRQKMEYWGSRCWICGGPYEAVDHVKPLSKGGLHILSNLRPVCRACNTRKGNKWPYP